MTSVRDFVSRLLGASVVALTLSTAAVATDLSSRIGVGGAVGPTFPIGNDEFKDGKTVGPGGGGWLGYGINRRWSARIGYDNYDPPACAPTTTPAAATPQAAAAGTTDPSGSVSIETVQLSGAYALAPDSAWNPSVRVGVGPAWVHGYSKLEKETNVGVSAGLGVDRFVTDHVSVGAAVDWIGVMGQGEGDAHAIRPGLTAGYWFGGGSK